MNRSQWIRQIHRWLSVAFTVAVIVNIVALGAGKYTNRLGLGPAVSVVLLLFTGMYLFARPYAPKWRSGRRTD